MIRPQQNDEPASDWRSLAAHKQQTNTGDTEPVMEIVGVVGGSMSGKGSAVNTGDLPGQEVARLPAEVRAAIVVSKSGNSDGASRAAARQTVRNELPRRGERERINGGRKVEPSSEGPSEAHSARVPATDKQAEEALWQRHKAQRGVWSEKMLMALERGVKGNVWFSLIDKIYATKTLELAWAKVQSNAGACGVDCITVEHFAKGSQNRLLDVNEHIREGTYQPKPVKRVMIPKLGSSESRPLGIPTVRDRVVQTAVRMVVEPIFEREFAEHSYGFRPGRGCKDALRRVDELLQSGLTHVVDVDIKGYFDSIPHERLMELVRERIADRRVLDLIESFLKQGIMNPLGWIEPEDRVEGTPQGGVISPLLANIYLNPLDQLMSKLGHDMVRYADDMVILCPSAEAAETVLQMLREWSAQAELTLHSEKTKIIDMGQPKAHFDFLGYRFWRSKTSGSICRFIRPKSMEKLREAIKPLTKRTNGQSLAAIVKKLRPKLQGFFNYFQNVRAGVLNEMDGWIRGRLRSILRKRAGGKGRGRGLDHYRWPNRYFNEQGLFNLEEARKFEIIRLRLAANY